MDIQKIKEYCNREIEQTDISYIDDAKNKPYISIDVIRRKLDGLTDFGVSWSTQNFKYIHNSTTEIITSSIDLNLGFRVLTGGANANRLELLTKGFDNFVGSVKSMSITNAARDLGRFFGSELYVDDNIEKDQYGLKIDRTDFGSKEYNLFKESLTTCNKKLAQSMLDSSEFKDVLELQLLIKKLKD